MENIMEDKGVGTLTSRQRNRLFIYITICVLLNLIAVQFIPLGQAEHLNGQNATAKEIKSSTIITILIGIPLLGFFLATLVSLIPYKGLPYSKKYLRFSLLIILIIESVLFVLSLQSIYFSNK